MTQNKPVALVTGASRGIGRAIAIELAKTHRVLGTYRGNLKAAQSLRQECGAAIFQMDVSSRRDRKAVMVYLREEFGSIDLLVNNAGMAPRERNDILEASEESFAEVIDTNLRGPYFLTQAAAGMMVKAGSGRIVFITSISSYTASTNRGEYCISKAGLSMATQLYASRLAPEGIGVFEIRPGIIETDMVKPVLAQYRKLAAEGLLPQGRLGQPEDIAKAVRAIADAKFDYSAGLVLDIDGGFHLREL